MRTRQTVRFDCKVNEEQCVGKLRRLACCSSFLRSKYRILEVSHSEEIVSQLRRGRLLVGIGNKIGQPLPALFLVTIDGQTAESAPCAAAVSAKENPRADNILQNLFAALGTNDTQRK